MTFEEIIEAAKMDKRKKIAVVGAADKDVLKAVSMAAAMGIVSPVLLGSKEDIGRIAAENELDIMAAEIIDEPNLVNAARRGVELAANQEVDALMKGQIHSAIIMKAILDKECGIRESSVLSHVGIIQSPKIERLLFLTDGAMCMYPDLKQKIEIVKNAVSLARRMGIELPKVAVLAAVETVNPDMPATLDAAALAVMNQRGQIKDCIVDGPLALDNAIDAAAAKHKGVTSPVGVMGHADILLVPNIEAGNILLKASRHLADCQTVGLVIGAKVPVVMSSRADTAANKLYAIACAVYRKNYLKE